MPGSQRQNNMFESTTGYVQKNNPSPITSCGRRRSPLLQTNQRTKGEGAHFRETEKGAGLTPAGVASYKAQNPGSNLKTAVTGKVKAGSKDAKRRGAFCARSKGWTGERGKAARERWKC